MLASTTWLLLALCGAIPAGDMPQVTDPEVVLELVADSPDVRTPVGITVDERGRVIVVESHTHFRPDGYDGPKADRILRMSNFDVTGKAQKIETIYEGTTFTMNVAMHPSGRLFVATRGEIFALDGLNGDDLKSTKVPIAHLVTKGNYPHNGLSGFAFDLVGNVYFGFGENLGASYELIGDGDGRVLAGGGEGGNIYRCTVDGKKLDRVATGFWNPFHLTFDAAGHLFMVDNDPDSRPPCRLIHVVEAGDYGYRFRYGRKGTSPLQAWNGELPGTLPMVAGTGEAPSGLLFYQSTGLPEAYRGQLLSTSWGDHRIEAFKLEPRGASFVAQMKPLVTGGENFRPVGIAIAPDGSVFFSDWVDKSYSLHGKGRVWRLRSKDFKAVEVPKSDAVALTSGHLPHVLKAAAKMTPAVAEEALKRTTDVAVQGVLRRVVRQDESALRLPQFPVDETQAQDPFVQQQVAEEFVRGVLESKGATARKGLNEFNEALAYRLLAMHTDAGATRGVPKYVTLAQEQLPKLLASKDQRVRLLAVVWIGDQRLRQYLPDLEKMVSTNVDSRQLFEACLAAIDLLQDKPYDPGKESPGEEYVVKMLEAGKASPEMQRFALRTLRADHPALSKGLLVKLLATNDVELKKEAIKTLRERTTAEDRKLLRQLASDSTLDAATRCEAIMGLAQEDAEDRKLLLALAVESSKIGGEAVRSLRGAKLSAEERETLAKLQAKPNSLPDMEALAKVLTPDVAPAGRPVEKDVAAWLSYAGEGGSAAEGERIFFHPRLVACARCHEYQGRGQKVGPALTALRGTLTNERLVQSIVDPSKEIAPMFTPWSIVDHQGNVRQGLYVSEVVDGTQTFVDTAGNRFSYHPRDVESRTPSRQSIMPNGLAEQLTKQEWADLVAFLRAGAKGL